MHLLTHEVPSTRCSSAPSLAAPHVEQGSGTWNSLDCPTPSKGAPQSRSRHVGAAVRPVPTPLDRDPSLQQEATR